MFPAFKQVWGKYGHERSYAHNNVFLATPSGGTTNDTFACWILEHHTTLHPDAANVPGKQVIMKADNGTGRNSVDFISGAFLNEFHFFPGLPNGTEAGQEMDQLYAAF